MKKILFVLILFTIGFLSINAQTLTVSPNTLTIATPVNSTGTFNITSNSNWTATSSQTWLTVLINLNSTSIPYSGKAPDLGAFEFLQSYASGNGNALVKLTAQANPSNINRTATITITGTGVSTQIVTVTQGTNVTPSATKPATIFGYNKK